MAQLLHRADQPWTDLTTALSAAVGQGRIGLWMSFSGTVQYFATVDGCLTRTRQPARGSEHPGDGFPLIVEPPFFATACGCGDGTGYRSTRPLLVALVDGPGDMDEMCDLRRRLVRQMVDDGFDAGSLPAGHPPGPCVALYCARVAPDVVAGG